MKRPPIRTYPYKGPFRDDAIYSNERSLRVNEHERILNPNWIRAKDGWYYNYMNGLESESREDNSKKLVDFLRRIDAPAFFQNVLSGKEKIPSFDELKDYLVRINGIARKIPVSARRADGENVQLGGLGTVNLPRSEDKGPLLKYAYDALPKINPNDAKYMLPAVVNAVHLFADGNGRTSRALHVLLREFPSEEDQLLELRKALGVVHK